MKKYKFLNKFKRSILIVFIMFSIGTIYAQINMQIKHIDIIAVFIYSITCSSLVWFANEIFSKNTNYRMNKIDTINNYIDKHIQTINAYKIFIYMYLDNLEKLETPEVDKNGQSYYSNIKFYFMYYDLRRIVSFLYEYQADIEELICQSLGKIEMHRITKLLCEHPRDKFTTAMIKKMKFSVFELSELLDRLKSNLMTEKMRFYKLKKKTNLYKWRGR